MQSNLLRSSDSRTNDILLRVEEKFIQLKSHGISHGDRRLLRTRFQLIWGQVDETNPAPAATVWRRLRARSIYTEIQKSSGHLFLPAVLAIAPTECTKKSIGLVLDHIFAIESYESFRLNLGSTAKSFFETAAMEHGYAGTSGYLNFMKSVFPQRQEPRQYQHMYGTIPVEKIDMLFDIMRRGIETSNLRRAERERGDKVSEFAVALIPTGDEDCCFAITVGRKHTIESLRTLQLQQLQLAK